MREALGGGSSRWMGPESSSALFAQRSFWRFLKIGRRNSGLPSGGPGPAIVFALLPGTQARFSRKSFIISTNVQHHPPWSHQPAICGAASSIFSLLLPFLFCRCLPPSSSLLLWAAISNLHDTRSMLPRWVMLALTAESLVHYVLQRVAFNRKILGLGLISDTRESCAEDRQGERGT
jgi:hypothetical protein